MPSDCFGEVRESCANTRMSAQTLSTQRTGVAPSAHWTNLSKHNFAQSICACSCLRPRTMHPHKRFSSLGRLACSAFTNSDAFCSAKLGRNKSKCATPKISHRQIVTVLNNQVKLSWELQIIKQFNTEILPAQDGKLSQPVTKHRYTDIQIQRFRYIDIEIQIHRYIE